MGLKFERLQNVPYLFFHGIQFSKHFVIPKTYDAKTSALQNSGPVGIIFYCFGMLPAINLDNQLLLKADKIENIDVVRMLPAKLAPHLTIAKGLPEATFGIRHVLPQSALQPVFSGMCYCLTLHKNPSPP